MRLKLKATVVAAALLAAGAANASFVSGSATGNSTFGVVAFNTSTGSYYVRDLGYTLNTFLPNGGASITGSGEGSPVFDKTPEAGLTINKDGSGGAVAKANFGADGTWSTWYSAQAPGADLRFVVVGSDRLGTTTGLSVYREISSISTLKTLTSVSNGTLDNQTTNINGLSFAAASISNTGTFTSTFLPQVIGSFVNQGTTPASTKAAALGTDANLFYFTRTQGTGATGTTANTLAYANSLYTATFNLGTNGDAVYSLQAVSAVPLPPTFWMLGAGLAGMGAVIRRRRRAEAVA